MNSNRGFTLVLMSRVKRVLLAIRVSTEDLGTLDLLEWMELLVHPEFLDHLALYFTRRYVCVCVCVCVYVCMLINLHSKAARTYSLLSGICKPKVVLHVHTIKRLPFEHTSSVIIQTISLLWAS